MKGILYIVVAIIIIIFLAVGYNALYPSNIDYQNNEKLKIADSIKFKKANKDTSKLFKAVKSHDSINDVKYPKRKETDPILKLLDSFAHSK